MNTTVFHMTPTAWTFAGTAVVGLLKAERRIEAADLKALSSGAGGVQRTRRPTGIRSW